MNTQRHERNTRRQACRRPRQRPITVLLVVLALIAGCVTSRPANCSAEQLPRTRIGRPIGDGPRFLTGHLSINGTNEYGLFFGGFGASIVFRPQAAAEFLDSLYDWNTGLVLQADYQRVDGAGRRILSADIIGRRYLQNMRRHAGVGSSFVGAGLGGSEITIPLDGTTVAFQKWFSYLLEAGYEWKQGPGMVMVLKAQFRRYVHEEQNYSGYALQFHMGIPLPW